MTRPLIAILRGITPTEIIPIVSILLEEGIQNIEIPLNSPDPFTSIKTLVQDFAGQGTFGAGTVLQVQQVQKLADIGAQMVVSPNCDIDVIKATKAANMQSFPGVMTPTECFAAFQAGADGCKFFPGDIITPIGLKAMLAVLPKNKQYIAVGGVNADNFAAWLAAGATGFGIGSALYKAGDNAKTVRQKAMKIIQAYDQAS